MPVKRTLAKRSRQLDDYCRMQLLEGPDAVLLAGVGYLAGLAIGRFEQAPPEDQASVLAQMEADWRVHGPALTEWWMLGADAPHFSAKPWIFPMPDPAVLPWAATQFGDDK